MSLNNAQKHHAESVGSNYRGIPIYTEPGTHEAVFDVFSANVPVCRVLELGAGAGAFSQRLADRGYEVVSSDISSDGFQGNVEFRTIDLNSTFAASLNEDRFGAIVAVEVLEHLESPLHFIRQVGELLDSSNSLWVSFPNIYLYSAIPAFIRRGEFVHWSAQQYWDTGHQTILTDWLFRAHCEKCGLVVKQQFYCNPVNFKRAYPGIGKRFLAHLLLKVANLFSPLSGKARCSESVLFQIVREDPIACLNVDKNTCRRDEL